MTNTEFFATIIPELSLDIVKAILVFRNIDVDAEFSVTVDGQLAEADILMRGVLLPEFSEGSLSIKYNITELKNRANYFYKLHGDSRYNSGQPIIKRVKL